ncbi:tetratricopeptide repeat protein [Bradyrhizobium sp. B097]|uniref:tetratricopeptide repeat protein n=1 Tax=Bradyrhizobium sp. B097 TaxID=3140244 RepID=UPI0031831596
MFDDRGLELSSNSEDAVSAYNEAIRSFLEYRTTAMPLAKQAADLDPQFCLAHCLRGYFFMVFGTLAVLDKARAALGQAQRTSEAATDREKRHVEALRLWIEGDLTAANACWERILYDYPHDLLALRLHHFNSFWMGQTRALRSIPASVLADWRKDMPGYGNLLGMVAFGCEENGDYANAERYGREAAEVSPDDLWALHAVAHVLEMQGRHSDGLKWLNHPLDQWNDRNPFRRHLWWHKALFHIDAGRLDGALELYDSAVMGDKSDFYLDIQNAASLLARLEFCGVNVGARWAKLADYAENHIDDHALVFTDIHFVMSLAREGRFGAARRLIESMKAYSADELKYVSGVIQKLGVPLCESIIAFEQGRYDDVVDGILPLRHVTGPVGASHAQRDIFDQYLLEAALRANKIPLAQKLLQERRFLKPGSHESDYKQARLQGSRA